MFRPTEPPDFEGMPAVGLIDTGATVSGIGPRVIDGLGLRSWGKNRLGSATEERMVDYYLFRLGIPSVVAADPPAWPYLFDRIDGFSWSREANFDVIVGMDVLQQGTLHLSGGWCTLTFN